MVITKFKNFIAQQNYTKKWDELSVKEQNKLKLKHKQQFDIFFRKARKEMDTKNDHDNIIEIKTILKELKKDFNNHLQDHKKYMYLAFFTAIGAIVTLAITLLKVL